MRSRQIVTDDARSCSARPVGKEGEACLRIRRERNQFQCLTVAGCEGTKNGWMAGEILYFRMKYESIQGKNYTNKRECVLGLCVNEEPEKLKIGIST
jgi:hypothetical protein